ncbi:GuaB1 family IMP dehydrogenase-related protein [Salinibacterium sp. SWN167]|uniref:GMP reductase n=1 Tax=Salinibacterium sp. SWN167 TaxID=2792054 RepID=UPI0018CD8CED|nr:GuaB1 family IMP dehydrogenase-related protein [Salinibacterium sp. SWN167]MBH0084589.1 GuaB1 family IMP dehydrogenase-related protein [Salinibacterium sp. SWN167]
MDFYETTPTHDLTYSDVFLVPSHSSVGSRMAVSLAPGDGTPATIPLVASNMNSVTGPRLAASLARRGGLGVLPQDLSDDDMAEALAWVRNQPVDLDSAVFLSPNDTVEKALLLVPPLPGHGVVLQNDGELVGVVDAEQLATAMPGAALGDIARADAHAIDRTEFGSARELFDLLVERGLGFAPVVEGTTVAGTTSKTSALRSTLYTPALDGDGKLAVAAALGINGDVGARARALVVAGACALVLDTAHGHQEGMVRAIETVAALDLGVPLVAGNVVTSAAVRDLVEAGATIIKVGVGPGAMCTTRMMTAVGRPQFSAVLETAATARELGAHVWADGGVRYPRDVALALAAGATSVMIGSWFAGTIEAPGELRHDDAGALYKTSWGMASTKAVRARFGGLDAYDLARKELFAEGISGSKIYLDPARPSIDDLVDMITSGVRSSCTYAGAATLREFRERALVGIQSAAGYEEGKALPVSW